MTDASGRAPRRPAIDRLTSAIFGISAVVLLPIITVVITADAFLRYVFSSPISWAQDFVGLCLFVLFCAALTHSMAQNVHVRMDLVYDMLPRRLRKAVDVISAAFALLFSAMLAYQAVPSTLNAWRTNAMMPSGEIVIWPFAALGSACLLIFGLAVIVRIITGEENQTG